MVYQSNIRKSQGEETKVEPYSKEGVKVEGVFVIENAYDGSYEYFRPATPEPTHPPVPNSAENHADHK